MGKLRGALRLGLRVLAQGGPEKVADKPTTNAFIQPWLDRSEAEVDDAFFPELWDELDGKDTYDHWKLHRRKHAEKLLEAAGEALPLPVARRYRARVKGFEAQRNEKLR